MPKVNLGHVVGRALTWEDLTEEQKLSLKGEKGNTPEVKAGKTTIVEYDEGAKVTSETNGDVTSFNFQIPVGQRPPFYGTYENFPEIGDINRLYIDDSITPRLIYTWDDVEKKYIITSGVDSIAVDTSPENIGTYIETIGDQTVEYKMVDTHPIINGVLNKLAYFKTHASAVWYNKLAGITVLDKLNSLTSNIGNISQLSTTDKTSVVKAVNELNENLGGFHFYHSLTELGINSPSTMTYQDFVNNMPENSILVCYLQDISFAPNSSDGCALFVKCTGSSSSKKIIFETTSMSGASSDFYMARYSAAAGTQWTGWIQIPTSTQLDTKLAKSNVANNLTTTASGKALDARQGKVLNDKFQNMFKTVTGSKQYNVGAGLGIAVTNISYTVPEGYKAVGPIGFYTGSDQVFPLRLTHNRMDVRNVSTGSITATATITVLCVKNF